ncbi:hypothetical protein P4S72_29020 [Vibrio sp. PP-XX7]
MSNRGWGGRFDQTKKRSIRGMSCMDGEEAQYDPYYMYGNTSEGGGAISRWRNGYNNEFEARMDWSITGNFSDANHPPLAVVNGNQTKDVLYMTASSGSTVALSASGSRDPDGNGLVYSWLFDNLPSSYNGSITIHNGTSPAWQMWTFQQMLAVEASM